MPATKGRRLGQVLAVLAALVAGALPAGASIPRPGDQLLEPDAEALLAAAREPASASPQAEAAVSGDRFDLLAPAAVDRLLFTGRPPRSHLFAELEIRVRASDLLSLPQPLEIKELTLKIASGDRETGLYYAKARYYDPELGLFLTQDPFEGVLDTPPSLHRYLYAYQNPTVYTDPTGRVTAIKLAQTLLRVVKERILSSTGEGDESQNDQQEQAGDDDVNRNSLLAAGLSLADSALEVANLAANTLVLDFAPNDSKIRKEVEAEIDQAIDDVKADVRQTFASAKKLIVEDPDGMVKLAQVPDQIMLNGLRTGFLAVAAEDPEVRARNRAEVYEFAGETLVLAGTAEGAGQAFRVVRRGVRATEEISGLAEGAEIIEQTAVSGRRLGAVSEGVGPGGEVFETGVNVTPRSSAVKFRTIGRGSRTFVTEPDALESVIGPLEGNRISISAGQARQLESALGLRPNSLEARNIISIVENVSSRLPGSPITGNPLFKGGGAGLPGGGQELTIQGIPSAGGPGIRQVILEVR